MNSSQNLGLPSTVRKYDLVIFDLDGTLLDTAEGILSAVRFTVDYFHLRPIPEERIRNFIGPPIQYSFAKEYGVSTEVGNEYAAVFRDHYKDHDLMKATPYIGIVETLKELRAIGCRIAVATYKREDYAVRLLDHFDLLKLFDVVHGSDFAGKLKKTDIIQLCIDELGTTDKSKIIYVGDTDGDRSGAQEVGIDFLGVTYGFGFDEGDLIAGEKMMISTPTKTVDAII